MPSRSFDVKSEQRGGHWVAWVVRTPEGKPDKSVLVVGQTKDEAEDRARAWAEGRV